jgi:methoxymalonate biosynthesis acyl carrier protein
MQLIRRLERVVKDNLGIEIPAPDVDLIENGLIDSLAFVELLLLIEREFGTPIDLEAVEIDDFRSLASIAAFLERTARAVSA